MSLKSNCIAAFILLNCYVLSLSTRLNIERGDRDIFDNPNCDSRTKTGCKCKDLNAECVDGTNCKRCRCSSKHGTFLSSNDKNDSRCVKNRLLLFIPASSESFLVGNTTCIKPDLGSRQYFVEQTVCNEDVSTQHWIWTQDSQLMHVHTLRCLQAPQRVHGGKTHFLVLKECDMNKTRQLWSCEGKAFFFKMSNLYMSSKENLRHIFATTDSDSNQQRKWVRYKSGKNLCFKAFSGCYEFVDPASAVWLIDCPQQSCHQQSREVVAYDNFGGNVCFVIWDKLQYLDNNIWKQLHFRDEIFTIRSMNQHNRRTLMLDFTNITNRLTGLIVKLHFYCAEKKLKQVNGTNIKCVVIKFSGTGIVLDPTSPPPSVQLNSTVTTNFTSTSTDTISRPTSASDKHSKSDPSNVTIIVVCVVIASLIICGLLGFIFYKRIKRSAENRKPDSAVIEPHVDITDPIYSQADINPSPYLFGDEATYQEPQTDASGEIGANNVYDYADIQQNGKRAPLQEHTYDYAKSDDVRPVAQRLPIRDQSYDYLCDAQSEGKVLNANDEQRYGNTPVYHTLEDS